jgi:hypothetical protein
MTAHSWDLPADERNYLRGLARRQAEIAALPVMAERRRMWYDLNDAKPGARPPVIIETWTFDRDFMPPSVLRCESQTGKTIERQLLRNIRNHDLVDDDKVIPDDFSITWFTDINELGVTLQYERVKDAQGFETGYHILHPITDITRDLDLLKPATASVDREKTMAWKAFLEDLLGEFLPVRLTSGLYGMSMLTHRVVDLMGMEAFFMAMYETPDQVHRLMAYLRDNCLRLMRWAEAEGLLCVNNGNQASFGSSYNFTTRLPAPGHDPARVRLADMWGASNSQETVGVAPEMFHEFCFPYYRDVCAPMGLLYYGCCEATHPYWEDLRRLPHLKKISISRWCDEAFMGEALRGTELVFSRKPDPNFLSLDEKLNESAWSAHIRQTIEATRGVFVEFIIRDVYTVHGNVENARRAVALARAAIDRHWRG